jgi:hypothetical protein
MTGSNTISRRQVLNIAANAAGASLAGTAAVIGTSPARAAGLSQKAVKYQGSPKGDQRCDNCSSFSPPLACRLVDGAILPTGWCLRYTKR